MRTLEIMLILLSFLLLLQVFFIEKVHRRIAIGTCLLCVGIAGGQLVIEGYRWQLFFVYVISAILIFFVLFVSFKKAPRLNIWNPLKYSLYVLSALLLVFSLFLAVYLPVFHLPKPGGPHIVGTQTFHFTDHNRDETLTKEKNDKRQLMVQVWYPGENVEGKNRDFLFPADQEIFAKYKQAYSKELHIPAFALDYWKYSKSNSYTRADVLPSRHPYPVVLLSHGGGASRILHSSQAENLASHGFIVVGIDHTYGTIATAFPDGRVTGFEIVDVLEDFFGSSSKHGKIWTADIEFVLSQLQKVNSGAILNALNGKIDLQNIGAMGHSFGGATAFNASYENAKIKAGINMDGTLYNVDNAYHLKKPFMFIQSQGFEKQKKEIENGTASSGPLGEQEFKEIIAYKKKEFQMIDNALMSGGTLISVKGAEHFNFTDLQLFSDLFSLIGFTGKIDGERSAFIVNQYVLDFFNKHLKGKGGELIRQPNPKHPEVVFFNNEA